MSRFTIPRDIYFGKGSLEVIKTIKAKKAIVVVGGGSMKRNGFLDKLIEYLREASIEVRLFEGVETDPSIETVYKGAGAMSDFQPDLIISIGGGSAIDAAKAMWVFYEHPEIKFKDIIEPFTIPELRKKARFIAIPSTSGTATEVTAFSVITDYANKIKYPLADYNITPDIAIVDPNLVETMPKTLTAHTGMDALTHAIEAYVASLHSPFSDPLAIQAIHMINDNLLMSYNEDMDARENIHYAQCLAGMAFTNALLGITHSMAHKTGAVFNIPHGCANAIYLPYVIDFNKKSCMDRYAYIAKKLNLKGDTDEQLVDSLTDLIINMNKELNIPSTLKEYGVDENEFKNNVKLVSKRAILDACTGSNPREISEKQMESLFYCIYYGVKVNF
ncbi:MAG: iron-containing alcohol dehydrogenase [Clostridium sp.]